MIDLKKYRIELGLSISEFAKKTKIPAQNVGECEKGIRNFSLDKKIKILESLGYKVEIKIER